MNNKILSIIIPTKNRSYYVLDCIKSILDIKEENFEIIIQDNSDDDSLKNEIKENFNDERVIYNYVKESLSFVENFSQGLKLSTGDYVVFIGDDDGVSPQLIEFVNWAKKNNLDSIQYNRSISYLWPEVKNNYGSLTMRGFKFKIKEINAEKNLNKMLLKGDFIYNQYNLVEFYHGIVKRELFEKIHAETGHYFGGLTPDIYGAIALTIISKKNIYIDFPITFHGVCPKSGSSDSQKGLHTNRDLKTAPHFLGHKDYKWNKLIPEIYTVETIWGETALQALKDFKDNTFIKTLNIKKMYSNFLFRYPEFKEEIISCANQNKIKLKFNLFNRLKYKLNREIKKHFIYLFRLVKYIILGRKEYDHINHISETMKIISENNNYKANIIKFSKMKEK